MTTPFIRFDIPEIKNTLPKIKVEPSSINNPTWYKVYNSSYDMRIYNQFNEIVTQTPTGIKVVQELSKDHRVQSLLGKMIYCGNSAVCLDINRLSMWFIWFANEYGTERANESLNEFLDANEIPVINTVWVLGIDVDNDIALDDGYQIRLIDNMPDSGEKEEFMRKGAGYNRMSIPTPICAITRSCNVNKVDDGTHYFPDEFFITSNRLREIVLLLNALEGIFCQEYCANTYLDNNIPFGPFRPLSRSGSPDDVMGRGASKLTAAKAAELNKLIASYIKLENEEKNRFIRILNRLSLSKRGTQIDDKILDLGIALEMMLLGGNENNEQLSLTFRLRGSWLLAMTKEERKEIYGELKKIYKYRSQVAHSGALKQKEHEEVRKSFSKYQSLAERTFRHLLINGAPKWDDIILGAL